MNLICNSTTDERLRQFIWFSCFLKDLLFLYQCTFKHDRENIKIKLLEDLTTRIDFYVMLWFYLLIDPDIFFGLFEIFSPDWNVELAQRFVLSTLGVDVVLGGDGRRGRCWTRVLVVRIRTESSRSELKNWRDGRRSDGVPPQAGSVNVNPILRLANPIRISSFSFSHKIENFFHFPAFFYFAQRFNTILLRGHILFHWYFAGTDVHLTIILCVERIIRGKKKAGTLSVKKYSCFFTSGNEITHK